MFYNCPFQKNRIISFHYLARTTLATNKTSQLVPLHWGNMCIIVSKSVCVSTWSWSRMCEPVWACVCISPVSVLRCTSLTSHWYTRKNTEAHLRFWSAPHYWGFSEQTVFALNKNMKCSDWSAVLLLDADQALRIPKHLYNICTKVVHTSIYRVLEVQEKVTFLESITCLNGKT